MRKHLSIVGCGDFGPAAAGVVSMVNAAVKEPTMVAVLTMFLDPMGFSSPEKLALRGTCCAQVTFKTSSPSVARMLIPVVLLPGRAGDDSVLRASPAKTPL